MLDLRCMKSIDTRIRLAHTSQCAEELEFSEARKFARQEHAVASEVKRRHGDEAMREVHVQKSDAQESLSRDAFGKQRPEGSPSHTRN